MSSDETDLRSTLSSIASDVPDDPIVKRGRLGIMVCQKMTTNEDFETYYTQLTKKCCLKVRNLGKKDETKSTKFYINQCCIMDDACLFRLEATRGIDFKTDPVELICRCKDKFLRNEWLISIESCLRQHVTHLFDEIDSLRGYMEVCFVNKKGTIYTNAKFKGCFCYYYQKIFKVKDFDPNTTLSYRIKEIKYEVEGRPLCFLLRATDAKILVRTDNPDTHLLWSTYIQNDIDAKYQRRVPGEFSGLLLIRKENSPDFVRMNCTYDVASAMLDITDSTNTSDFMKVLRCIVVPPKTDLKYHFSLICQMRGEISSFENKFLYCRAATKEEAEAWISALSPPMKNAIKLLKIIVAEIEIRRTFKHEYWSSTAKYEILTYEEINDLIVNVDNANNIIRDAVKCPVKALEKAVRAIFKFMPQPVIPFDQQEEFLEISQRMKKSGTEKLKMLDLFVQLPTESQEILKILSGHVSRVISHNKDKCPEITVQEAEVIIWSRLCTNLLKIYDQDLSEREREDLLDAAGRVLPIMVARVDSADNDDANANKRRSTCKPL